MRNPTDKRGFVKPDEQAKTFQRNARPSETTPAMLASNQYTRVRWCPAFTKKTPARCRRSSQQTNRRSHDMTSLPDSVNFVQKRSRESSSSLDLYSIRQTDAFSGSSSPPLPENPQCINHPPFFACKTSVKGYTIAQGNCHDWKCPRCGISRAKQEYKRIVEGCRILAEQHDLYFMTLTCRGREISFEQSEAGYYTWTNRLLTTLRKSAKKVRCALGIYASYRTPKKRPSA